ncbi:tyrosine-type recombinase/integrase [Kineococcus sp. R86509]|uniref:tyrosine-type recombinase/integrase n=1 Tax=Kineococcus sp. R86509 TaxID=3093851 RepID=UPI0036D40404
MSEPTTGSPATDAAAAVDPSNAAAEDPFDWHEKSIAAQAASQVAAARAVEAEQLSQLRDKSISEATWTAYLLAWHRWSTWAIAHGRPVLPANPHDLGAWAQASVFPDFSAADAAAEVTATPAATKQTPRRRGRPRPSGPISASTLTKRMAAVTYIHLRAGHPNPLADAELAQALRGLRRTMKENALTPRQAPALMTADIERILTAMDVSPTRGQSLAEVRDRALILLAFTTAMRASELAALNVDDLEPDAGGLIVRVRSSKTDQEGAGTFIAVPRSRRPLLCPIRAMDTWLERLQQQLAVQDLNYVPATDPGLSVAPSTSSSPVATDAGDLTARRHLVASLDGAVLRAILRNGRVGSTTVPDPHKTRMSSEAISEAITARARAAGLQPPERGGAYFTAHSTRAGFATQAAENGVSERNIMAHGRWKSVAVARGYIRRGEVFDDDNAAGHLGL